MKFLLHKDKKKMEKPAHKIKSVAALPCNHPFAATHMLFLQALKDFDYDEMDSLYIED